MGDGRMSFSADAGSRDSPGRMLPAAAKRFSRADPAAVSGY